MQVLLIANEQPVDQEGDSLEEMLSSKGISVIKEQEKHHSQTVDAVILVDQPERLPFLAAIAMSENKPLLSLLFKTGQNEVQLPAHDLIRIRRADPEELQIIVDEFIRLLSGMAHVEKPTIKFTLRVTPAMDRYLQWKGKQTGMKKADFLRKAIQKKIIDPDQDYEDPSLWQTEHPPTNNNSTETD